MEPNGYPDYPLDLDNYLFDLDNVLAAPDCYPDYPSELFQIFLFSQTDGGLRRGHVLRHARPLAQAQCVHLRVRELEATSGPAAAGAGLSADAAQERRR